jgi:hypothetical protein
MKFPGCHSSVQDDEIPSKSIKACSKHFHLIAPLGKDQRTPARFQCRQHVIEYHRIARLIAAERRINGRH